MGKNSWKKIFGMVYAGQAFSIVGSAAAQFAVIWWLTAQTGSAVTLTLASIVSLLPNMFLGPFAGVWVDRCNRKWVMIAADGLVALSSVALAVAFWLWQAPSVLFIYGVLFIRGIGNTFHSLAMEAAIPMFVPVDKLTKAGGWGRLISSLSNMLGPALGAGMLEILPVSLIQLFDVAGALVASLCLLPVSLPKAEKKGEKVQLLADLRQGFAAMKENKPLMVIFFPLLVALSAAGLRALYGRRSPECLVGNHIFCRNVFRILGNGHLGWQKAAFFIDFRQRLCAGNGGTGRRLAAAMGIRPVFGLRIFDRRNSDLLQYFDDCVYTGNGSAGGGGQGIVVGDDSGCAGDSLRAVAGRAAQRADWSRQDVCGVGCVDCGGRHSLLAAERKI